LCFELAAALLPRDRGGGIGSREPTIGYVLRLDPSHFITRSCRERRACFLTAMSLPAMAQGLLLRALPEPGSLRASLGIG
jgi:hypothetical protein